LISGRLDRRRRALFWSTIASTLLHAVIISLLLLLAVRIFVPQGTKETVTEQSLVTIQKEQHPTPSPQHRARPVRQRKAPRAQTPRYELAKTVTRPATPQPPRPPVIHSTPSSLARDQAGFAKEVAQLNRQNDPHSIPTIDPAARASSSKTYQFALPSTSHGSEHGNGIITPVRSWRDGSQDCYYGKYEYTYANGSMEDGSIVWPFCYDADEDPFKEPPHPIPFPMPLPGFKLPADADMPPLEKAVYQQWASENGISFP
jgi:hypothetical protein